jgi:H+/Cl- antiporter ClcA
MDVSQVSTRRNLFLASMAVGIGLAAGAAAFALLHLIALITNLALFGRWGWELPSLAHLHPGPWLFVAAVSGGLLVAVLAKWSPIIKGHGIPEAMECVLTRESRIAPRTAIAKPLSAAIAIGTGGPFGAEGPIIVTGGALGSLLGQVVRVSPSERKILLASGAAAGMAATFGAPLAAVVLATELLLFEFSARAFLPLVIASSVAAGVHSAVFGAGPLFQIARHPFSGLDTLPLYVLLGAACGLLAVVLTRGLSICERAFQRLPISDFWHPAIGAAGFALVGLAVPRALGVGYDSISDVLAGRLALATLLALGLAKLIAWWIALGSRTSGGTLAPILLISGTFGAILGELISRTVPGTHLAPGAFALAAMAATFGASTGATFASIVFVFELTRDYDAILPLMMAAVVASFVARALMKETLLTETLVRRGLTVPSDYYADALRTTTVAEVMSLDVSGVGPSDVELGALRSTDAVLTALGRMLDTDVDHLPVVDGDEIVGVCTRSDIVAARRHQFVHERLQAGWRPARWSGAPDDQASVT